MKKLLTILAVMMLATMAVASVTVFEGEQKDVDFKVKVGGYFQFRWEMDLNNGEVNIGDEDDPEYVDNEAEAEGNLKVKRAKVDFKGDIGDYWKFKVVDYVSKPKLEEMKLTFMPVDMFWIDFGLLKPAGSYLHNYSSSKQPFVDRPMHDDWMPSFSEGMVLNFKYENYIHLAIGVWDNDNLEALETTGGGVGALSDMDLTVWANSKFMEGLNFGGFFYMGNDRTLDGYDLYIPVMGYGAHANYTWDYIYVGAQFVMGSLGFSDPVDAAGESVDVGDDVNDVTPMAISGDLLGRFEIGSDFLDLIEVGGRFEMIDMNSDDDAEYDSFNIITGGLNLYFTPDHFAKLQINYVHTLPEDEENMGAQDGMMKMQLQLKF